MTESVGQVAIAVSNAAMTTPIHPVVDLPDDCRDRWQATNRKGDLGAEAFEAIKAQTQHRRIGDPAEIASAIAYDLAPLLQYGRVGASDGSEPIEAAE